MTEAFKYFMGISTIPEFETEYFELDLGQSSLIAAQAQYDEETGKFILRLPLNCDVPKFLLFHELTHIYDMSILKTGEKNYDFCLSGYLEYHASQVELMVLLEAKKTTDCLTFSMGDSVNYLDWTVWQYLENKLSIAIELIANDSQEKQICGLEVFYNFLGLKSVCNMYATDFKDEFNYKRIADRLPSFLLLTIKQFMNGWIDDVETAVVLYSNAVMAIYDSVNG